MSNESIRCTYGFDLHGSEQLQKSKGNLSDFSKVLARTLKKYIKDGEQSSEKCNKCGSTLVFENGCKTCKNCGESYCG